MQAQDAVGARGVRGELRDGQRVGAGGDDRAGLHDAVEGGQDLTLGLEVLGHDLDDQIRLGRGLQVGERTESGEGGGALLPGDPLVPHGAGGRRLHGLDGLAGGGFADVDADDLMARTGHDIGDSGAHRAEADDGYQKRALRALGALRTVHRETPDAEGPVAVAHGAHGLRGVGWSRGACTRVCVPTREGDGGPCPGASPRWCRTDNGRTRWLRHQATACVGSRVTGQ